MKNTMQQVQILSQLHLASRRQTTQSTTAASKHVLTGLQGASSGEYVLLLVTVHRAHFVVSVAATCMVQCSRLLKLLR